MELQKPKNLKEAAALLNYLIARGAHKSRLEKAATDINLFIEARTQKNTKATPNGIVFYNIEKDATLVEWKIKELSKHLNIIKDSADKRMSIMHLDELFNRLLSLRNNINQLFEATDFKNRDNNVRTRKLGFHFQDHRVVEHLNQLKEYK